MNDDEFVDRLKTDIKFFELTLSNHNWLYQVAKEHKYYMAGKKERMLICRACNHTVQHQELYRKYFKTVILETIGSHG